MREHRWWTAKARRARYARAMSAHRATWVPAVLVALLAAGLSGVLGELAAWLYQARGLRTLGRVTGAVAGLAVAAAWTAWMRRRAGGRARPSVLALGALGGLASGSAAALALHLALSIARSRLSLRDLLLGQAFGLASGALLGLVGGVAWLLALAVAAERGPAAAQAGARAAPFPRLASLVVALASAGLGALLGALAGGLYAWGSGGGAVRNHQELEVEHPLAAAGGAWLGAALGLGAGVAWVAWMRRRRAWRHRAIFLARGLGGGLLAGALCAGLLHLGLQLAFGWKDALSKHLLGQLFALGPGLLLGLVGGALWMAASPPHVADAGGSRGQPPVHLE